MANLTFRAEYFKKHNEAWDEFAGDLTSLLHAFANAKPENAALAGTFLLGWMESFMKVQRVIEVDLYLKGIEATLEVGDKLEQSCRDYLSMEAENQAQADMILAKVGY